MYDSLSGRGGRRKRRRKRSCAIGWIIAGLLASGCLIDSDDLCGPNQVIWGDDEVCVCAEGTAYTPMGCVPCGENEQATVAGCVCADGAARASATAPCVPCAEHEIASPSGCVCDLGFSRSNPDAPCTELTAGGPGMACAIDAECVNPDYTHCQLRTNGTGYCTNTGCTTDAECEDGFRCVTSSSPAICKLPPDGAGRPCTISEDCAGTEALFCDTFMSQSCLVQDCNLDADNCYPGMECCDVGFGLPPICIPTGACQT